MAVTEPLDLLDGFPGWSTSFDLMARQEQSRSAAGRTRTKDFGSPLWRASYVSRVMRANELDRWRAILSAAMNDQMTFYGRALSRCRPIHHPGNLPLPTGTLHTIGANNKSIRADGLPTIRLDIGDLIQIGPNLHQVREPAAAVAGLTPLFEIRPHLWPAAFTGQAVVIAKPSCLMVIVPNSLQASGDLRTGRGSVSFDAIEARG
ncbi:hypothetical protein VW29_02645 [Devosia limi DSM 17137]|uniref:Uncharacterized protein n=1 Tax=Devosia limi DSM 17137 TaxID=1121477 RepID=A0A0F5LXT7_9HYPH|nr:hypothetical protein [Devosia limi]KKB86472.1 hypothetical protein VW29_02645 [Devosia limi DSM 17137]SHE87632.1 hypothetical protein SAMN02745223_01294 [Devosia limi DSM 17137]